MIFKKKKIIHVYVQTQSINTFRLQNLLTKKNNHGPLYFMVN